MKLIIKNLLNSLLRPVGFKIISIPKLRGSRYSDHPYFNNGELTSLEQNSQENNDRFYADRELLKNYYANYSRLLLYDEIIELIKTYNVILKGKKIADYGCGSGHLLNLIEKHFSPASLHGNDFSKKGIEFAKSCFPNYNFYEHNLYEDDQNRFDSILCTEVLEHLEYPDKVLHNLLTSLNDNGYLIITVPNGRLDSLDQHINFWSPESWKVFFEMNSMNYSFTTGLFNSDKNLYCIVHKK